MGLACLANAPTHAALTVEDDDGRALTLPAVPKRIVALAPSATALLFAVGAGSRIVATIQYSDDPPAASRIPRIGDVQSLDLERLLALEPDVVVITRGVTSPVLMDRVRALGLPMYHTRSESLAGLPESMRRLGALVGSPQVAEQSARKFETELEALRARYAGRARLRVMYQVWRRPVYTIGGRHVITNALELCGAANIFADLAVAAPAVTEESVIARNPDAIVASGPAADAHVMLDDWRRFPALAATANGRLLTFSDMRLDNMGPSALEATAALCALLDGARRSVPEVLELHR